MAQRKLESLLVMRRASTMSWQSFRDHVSIIKCTIRPERRTRTCGTARRAFTRSSAPVITTKVLTRKKTSLLVSLTAEELAKMPTYYIMDLDKGMAETVAAV